MIPHRFLRIWLGHAKLDPRFETWWHRFRELHPGWEFMTIGDKEGQWLVNGTELEAVFLDCDTYAAQSDVVRIAALHQLGGVYVDCDVMPLRSFAPLLLDPGPFAGKRSSRSFESAVLGSPPWNDATAALIKALPSWYQAHRGRAASVRTGPAFVSSVWWGRPDIRHLPSSTFYPYNGFGGPAKALRNLLFAEANFPEGMYAAHYSDHRWGGRPNKSKEI